MVRLFVKIAIIVVLTNNAYSKQIDICEGNYSCKQTYLYNYLYFDLNKSVVEHRYKFSSDLQKKLQSYYEIERKFKIVNIDEDGITFDQSFQSYYKSQHKMFLDDKYLIGSNYYKRKYEKKVNESGGVNSAWYRVKINPKKKIIEEIYWPLTKKPKKNIINLVFTEKQYLKPKQRQQVAGTIVFAASVYLYSKALDQAKSVNSTKQNINNPSSQSANKSYVSNSYTLEWARSNRLTPTWALPPAQRPEKVGEYLMRLGLFPE